MSILGTTPLRVEILRYLHKHHEGGTSGEIGRSIGVGYKTVLTHLKELEELGAVSATGGDRRIGQRVNYTLVADAYETALRDLDRYIRGMRTLEGAIAAESDADSSIVRLEP